MSTNQFLKLEINFILFNIIVQFYGHIVSLNLAIKTIVENPTKIVFNQYLQVKVMVQ